jgi:hypothetical protein
MTKSPKDEQFSAKEAKQRFEAALRGARATGPKPKPSRKRTTRKKRG